MIGKSKFRIQNLMSDYESVIKDADLFIYAVGYEARSSHFADRNSLQSVKSAAVVYRDGLEYGAFAENHAKFLARGHIDLGHSLDDFLSNFSSLIDSKSDKFRIVVDVSCLDRTIMSNLFMAIFSEISMHHELHVIYTPNKYVQPDIVFPPLKYFGPAVPQLSGRVGELHSHRCVIMGLGYEYGSALNVMEQMEPGVSYLYIPNGHEEGFLDSVRLANFDFDFGDQNVHMDNYYLQDMVSVYQDISSIVLAIKHSTSIAMVPFGPKLFSFICLLVAMENVGDVSFLRYSVATDVSNSKLVASGILCGVSMTGIDRNVWSKAARRGLPSLADA